MKWKNLHPAVRLAILREAVRRNIDVDELFVMLGGVL